MAGGLSQPSDGGESAVPAATKARASEARLSWLLGVPAVMLCALVYAQLRARGALRSEQRAALPHAAADAAQHWSGRYELAGGALELELAPLHAQLERQRFDAGALAARLGLEAGEPWALDLRWSKELAPAGGDSAEASASEPAGLALGGLKVEDAQGEALRALVECAAAAEGREAPRATDVHAARAVSDPLLQLYALPAAELAPGTSARCVLWGRAPHAGARLALGALRVELAAQDPVAASGAER